MLEHSLFSDQDACILPTSELPRLIALRERLQQRSEQGLPCDRLREQLRQLHNRAQQQMRKREAISWHIEYDQDLPVAAQRDHILAVLRQSPVVVLTGETGSGKTTQLPKMLLEVGSAQRGRMAITQPRRLAAVAVAQRLREECACGEERIAHAVRFDDRSHSDTRVVVQTDGLLLAELSRDPWLRRYDTLVIDEAHERSCTIDLLLALLLRLRRRRPDLRMVVTSATIDAERFAAYLGDGGLSVPLIQVPGRLYPVTCESRNPGDDDLGYLDAAVEHVREQHAQSGGGDFLVFLPTERDILEARRRLQDLPGATVLPCYGRLNASEQQRIFTTVPGRKVVLATPIAETSLTIPGITLVIDSGLARCKRFSPHARIERLPVEPVSQANLQQRAGRAGRLRPGHCIQLFAASDAAARPAYMEPEIRRSNLSVVLLQLLAAGHRDPESMPWMDPPRAVGWQQAWRQLTELGAIDHDRRLTKLGRRLARFPIDPALARICLAGAATGVMQEAVTVAAFLSIQDPRQRPNGEEARADQAHARFRVEGSDLLTICELWRSWEACPSGSARGRFASASFVNWRRMREWADVRRQLLRLLREDREQSAVPSLDGQSQAQLLHQAVLTGMLGGLQRYDPERGCYRGIGGKDAVVHPSSVMHRRRRQDPAPPPWIVACELVETSRLFARLCAPVEVEWILALAGPLVRRHYGDAHWHEAQRRLVVHEQITLQGLVLVDGRNVAAERIIGREAAEAVFVEQVLAGDHLLNQLPLLRRNARSIAQARAVFHRLRDPTVDYDQATVAQWYHQRLATIDRGSEPRPLTSLAALRHLLRRHGDTWLRLQASDCCPRWHEAQRLAPQTITLGPQLQAQVTYRYAPGDAADGATVMVAEADLARVEPWRCGRCIPQLLHEQVAVWLRQLPRSQRVLLGNQDMLIMEIAQAILDRSDAPPTACEDLLRQRLPADVVPPLSYEQVPAWTRPRWQIVDPSGRVLVESRDTGIFAGQAGDDDDPLSALRHRWRTAPSRSWPGDIPERYREGSLTAYPVLLRSRDAQAEVAVQRDICATAHAASVWHADGIWAWCECSCAEVLSAMTRRMQAEMGAYCDSAAAARAVILAALQDACGTPECRDQHAAQACTTLVAEQLEHLQPSLLAWARRLTHARQELERAQRKGGRGLSAMAQISAAQAASDRLLGGVWWLRYPWWGLSALPEWVAGITLTLQRPNPQALPRIQRLRSDWEHLTQWIDLPVARACGYADDWRQGHAILEECCYAFATGKRPRFQASELALRSLADALQRQVGKYFQAWEEAVRALREICRPLSHHDGPVIQQLLEHAHTMMQRGLDTGFAADVEQQPRDLEALRLRILRML
ncbi:MAG: ATP-dependent RNA helicase HrpA [Planctomycetota bacterium]|nr:MAG: ATP-dependent RNA helicase HrpA [Planctomycetota bacterium]